MRLNSEQRVIGFIAIFSLLIVTIILAIIWPTQRYLQSLDEETSNLRGYLEQRYRRSLSVRSSLQKIKTMKSGVVAEYPRYLFHRGQELTLITALETIATQNKVTQKIITSNFDDRSSRFLTLSLSATGSFSQLLHYLSDLERIHYFLIIRQVQMTPFTDPASNQNNVVMNIDLSLYVNQ